MSRVARGASFAAVLVCALLVVGCGGVSPRRAETPLPAGCDVSADPGARGPSTHAWRHAKRRLAELRSSLGGSAPHTLRLAVKLREPFTGRVMDARGAVALSPPSALRMILLGPGGTTALDLWANEDRFRFAVPAIDLLRRGDAATPRDQMRGLPVDFLTWWLLRPAYGSLLWYARAGAADRFVLRDGPAIVELCALDEGGVVARRTTWSAKGRGDGASAARVEPILLDEETVTATRRGCGPVRYTQASTGLSVGVECEGEETERAPNPRAFVDPDAPEPSGGGDGGGG